MTSDGSALVHKRNIASVHGRRTRILASRNDVPRYVLDAFERYYSGAPPFGGLGVGALSKTYDWPLPKSASTLWGPLRDCDVYGRTTQLKSRLHERWIRNPAERPRLAKWLVSDWGGVGRNKDTTLLRYVQMAETRDPETPLEGVASYSKVLSIADPHRYAIYDSRVAVALNAVQVIAGVKGLAFPYVPGRNLIIGHHGKRSGFSQLQRVSPNALERNGWRAVMRRDGYRTYLRLLEELRSRLQPKRGLQELEMTLFSQAERLALAAAPELGAGTPRSFVGR